MISAWVLSLDLRDGTIAFVNRNGIAGYGSKKPEDWGLSKDFSILLVLQQAQFIQAWVKGNPMKEFGH